MKYILIALVIIGYFAASFLKKSNNETKGAIGEKNVSKEIRRALKGTKYYLIDDLLISFKNSSKTTQLDHVLINNKGIFIIETKNYSGDIVGHAQDKMLKQYFARNERNFYNPLFQNKMHMNAVKAFLHPSFYQAMHGLVVFSGTAHVSIKGAKDEIIYLCELRKHLNSYKTNILSDQEIDWIYETLSNSNIKGRHARKEHTKALNTKGR